MPLPTTPAVHRVPASDLPAVHRAPASHAPRPGLPPPARRAAPRPPTSGSPRRAPASHLGLAAPRPRLPPSGSPRRAPASHLPACRAHCSPTSYSTHPSPPMRPAPAPSSTLPRRSLPVIRAPATGATTSGDGYQGFPAGDVRPIHPLQAPHAARLSVHQPSIWNRRHQHGGGWTDCKKITHAIQQRTCYLHNPPSLEWRWLVMQQGGAPDCRAEAAGGGGGRVLAQGMHRRQIW